MYDLTGRIQNAAFESIRHLQRRLMTLNAGTSNTKPLYILESNEDSDKASVAESTISEVSEVSSVLSIGFESLKRSLHQLDYKTEAELSILRQEMSNESAALFSAVDRLHLKLTEDYALLVDRTQTRSRSSTELELLAVLPLVRQPELGTLQEFSFRIIMGDEYAANADAVLELRCSGTQSTMLILRAQFSCDGSNYIIKGHLVNTFTGLEVVISSSPFVTVKRLPFDTVVSIELFVESQTEGAVVVSETMLYPIHSIQWR